MIWFRLLSRLPFPILYGLANVLYFMSYYLLGYRKHVVTANIDKAFPEKTVAEKQVITRQFYRNLSDIIVETVKLLTISRDDLRRRVTILNPALLLDPLRSGQSVIVMTSHQGNWEWLLQGCALHLQHEVDAVYKPLRRIFFNKLMLTIRSRFGPLPVPMHQLPRQLVHRKSVVRIIAMVADQAPAPEMAYWIPFLHQNTPFYTGSAKIAQRTGCPVLFIWMRRVKRGFYEAEVTPLAQPPYHDGSVEEVISRYAQAVEEAIRQKPAEWLWSHKRWKHQRVKPLNNILSIVR